MFLYAPVVPNPHLGGCQISGQNDNQVQQQLLQLKVLIAEGQLEVSDQWVMVPHCTTERKNSTCLHVLQTFYKDNLQQYTCVKLTFGKSSEKDELLGKPALLSKRASVISNLSKEEDDEVGKKQAKKSKHHTYD